jgi:polyhydroxybutyrate depolymerase
VFVTGPSNGGLMTNRVGLQLSGKVAAIAPVIGGLATPLASMFAPAQPVSVLMIQSTQDPWVPYAGGAVRIMGGEERGTILPAEETLSLWVKADGCGAPHTDTLPDEKQDGCRVTRTTYAPGRDGAEVVFLKVEGAGHTWPGGTQFLPEKLIGRTCQDFAATPYIWHFFAAHARKPL